MDFSIYWQRIFTHWQKDAKLWLFLMGIFTMIRISFLLLFSNEAGEILASSEIISCILSGAQFDARFALIGIAPSFVLSIFNFLPAIERILNKFRFYWGGGLVTLTVLAGTIDIGFFYEYHDQFNQWIFGVLYDDSYALMQTVWKDYPLIWISVGLILAVFILMKLLRKWLQKPFFAANYLDGYKRPWLARGVFLLLALFLIKCGVTCSFGWRTLSRKDTAVTGSMFLNNLVYNPYYALYSAKRDFSKRNSARGIEDFLPDKNIENAIRLLLPDRDDHGLENENYLKKIVRAPKEKVHPRHIFLVVMESQDNWPLLKRYESLNLSSNLKQLAREGAYIKNFVSAGVGTMPALNCLILGLPEVGIETQYQFIAQRPLSTSIAKQFKELGYVTKLYYGGYLSWRKLGVLAKNQGFDHIYGIGNIKGRGNEWGVHDADLFDFINESTKDDEPSFNLIMTTSNHPPYSVDLEKEGCPLEFIAEKVAEIDPSANPDLKVLGHFWYADRCLGSFVEKVESQHDDSLFVITGDHWSRRFINKTPSLYERKSVPLILYGKNFNKKLNASTQLAGSHLDIAPTLIELIAPEGFVYKSLGKNLLNPNERQIGFGADIVITPKLIVDVNSKLAENIPESENALGNLEDGDSHELVSLYNALHGIGWWRIKDNSKK